MTGDYRVKRAFIAPSPNDGKRILVDRLWPRGVSKEHAQFDGWAKAATPSNELRQWYHEDRDRYKEFRERYSAELQGSEQQKALEELRALHEKHTVTLVTAATDIEHSHVPILIEHLERS